MKTTSIRDERDETSRALDARILSFIGGADDDGTFDRLALEVYAYQFERNPPYRRYCERRGSEPSRVSSWRDVPAVPAASFADTRLACFGPDRTALTFVSSGTTTAGARASRHELDSTELYDAAIAAQYCALVLPDAPTMPHVFIAPPFSYATTSSLSYMLSALEKRFGAPGGGFYVHDDVLDFSNLSVALASASPRVVFGTAFSFVHFADRCRTNGVRFSLGPGSRVVETGGFKGKSREIARDDLYRSFEELLGVKPDMCVSEYGMCELGSQWYDANIADMAAGIQPRRHVKIGPHWTRTTIVDPVTALPVVSGETGLLQIFDLCNRGSVCSVLTGDLARERDGGVEIIGRHPGAPPKGCSIAADAMLGGKNA
jgi:acyl-protein synthetase LuxE